MRISIDLDMEEPQKISPPASRTVEDRVREAIECIESGFDSQSDWSLLLRLYKALLSYKKENRASDRMVNLMEMIHPVLAKYGYHMEK